MGTLEKLTTQVQQAANDSSPYLDHILRDAIHTTSSLLKSSLPENVSEPWLQELSKFSAHPKLNASPEDGDGIHSCKEERSHKKAPNGVVHLLAPSNLSCATSERAEEGQSQRVCGCGTIFSPSSISDDTLQAKHVKCIHGCGHLFHSARCRRQNSQAHAHHCAALQRKEVLKRIGLPVDPELF
ncbi:hypothetical protein FGB62_131g023 [Gracilaria domingensis]|nr:hypothetical protein FGB62_131g023 [Gracilaria domingensis]